MKPHCGRAATIIYTFVGGLLAVSWTDTVQASLMIFALIHPGDRDYFRRRLGDSLEVITEEHRKISTC